MIIQQKITLGKISTFGGPNDNGMSWSEGLSLYEHHEADRRPDLFSARAADQYQGTSKRLRPCAFFFAMRFPLSPDRRELTNAVLRRQLQATCWRFSNPLNGATAVAWLVDWGPRSDTGRAFDVSPGLADFLGVRTDQEVAGYPV